VGPNSGCQKAHRHGPGQTEYGEGYFVDRAIDDAVFILEKIDERWPSLVNTFAAKEWKAKL